MTAAFKVQTELKRGRELSIISLLDAIFEHAYMLGSSDIHIVPEEKIIRIRFRVDGVLQDVHALPKEIHPEIISRIKILTNLPTDEHQAALDGRFQSIMNGRTVDIRISIVPTYYGENVSLRILTDQDGQFTLDILGFNAENQKKIMQAIQKPFGMILVTGPTGSGKTTTLYTLIKLLNTKDISIITIEDPIEYAISGIEQVQVNARTGLTFANGLRSFLRQDPNIIMVGEIRDSETAGLAVNTALTGHLLLSTLHTNDASTTLPRLLDMKVEPYLVASTVNVAIGQRLVRRICEKCKKEKRFSTIEKKGIADVLTANNIKMTQKFYEGKGCEACNTTGYQGRIGIHEVLILDPEIREAIIKKASATEIREIARDNGMQTMIEDGIEKAKKGITTLHEILKIIHE